MTAPSGDDLQHRSDCSQHNEPAYPNGPCDCGAVTAPSGDDTAAAELLTNLLRWVAHENRNRPDDLTEYGEAHYKAVDEVAAVLDGKPVYPYADGYGEAEIAAAVAALSAPSEAPEPDELDALRHDYGQALSLLIQTEQFAADAVEQIQSTAGTDAFDVPEAKRYRNEWKVLAGRVDAFLAGPSPSAPSEAPEGEVRYTLVDDFMEVEFVEPAGESKPGGTT